jgi:hypothetical protein
MPVILIIPEVSAEIKKDTIYINVKKHKKMKRLTRLIPTERVNRYRQSPGI